jgi:hypothetical protein
MNIVIETTVSWRVGCIGFYHHRDWGWPRTGPALESRNSRAGLVACRQEESLAQSTGLLDIWKGRCWERAGIVIEKLIGRKMERSSKHFFAFSLDYFSLCFF